MSGKLGVSWAEEFSQGWENVSRILSRYGVHIQDTVGVTALEHAIATKNNAWVTAIVTHPKWASQMAFMRYPPFHSVLNTIENRIDDYLVWEPTTKTLFRTLLDAKCDPDQKNWYSETLMDRLAIEFRIRSRQGMSPLLEMLLKHSGVHSLFDSNVLLSYHERKWKRGRYRDPPVVTLTGPDVHPEVSAFVQAEVAAFKTEFFRVTDAVLSVRDVATIVYQYIVWM